MPDECKRSKKLRLLKGGDAFVRSRVWSGERRALAGRRRPRSNKFQLPPRLRWPAELECRVPSACVLKPRLAHRPASIACMQSHVVVAILWIRLALLAPLPTLANGMRPLRSMLRKQAAPTLGERGESGLSCYGR